MKDIPLAKAQVIWDIDPKELKHGEPLIRVIGIPRNDDNRYSASWGACNGDFQSASEADKLSMLFAKFVDITINDGLDPKDVHAAFMVIPEYRERLADVGGLDPALV